MKYRTGKPSISPNIFWRSTLRQPVKTALLLVVLALITFAFVSRAAEYLLVRQETERLGGYYRTIGMLESSASDQWADTSEAVDYLENNPYVEFVDIYNYTSGVIQDGFCNADTDLQTSNMSRYLVFCGTLWDYSDTYFHFIVDTVLAGSSDYISEGISLILDRRESQYTPEAQLITGERYLTVGYWPLGSEYGRTGKITGTHASFSSLMGKNIFYHIPEGQEVNLSDLGLEDILASIREEQASLNVIPTKDMSALPLVQGTAPQIYLTEGRWLDSQDDARTVLACVVHAGFASSRGLVLGDTITLKLRDIPSFFGYDQLDSDPSEMQTSTDTFEIVGIYDYMDQYKRTVVRNFAYIPASVVSDDFSMTTAETLGQLGTKMFERLEKETYSSAILPSPGAVSFVLKSPEAAESFLYEARNDLSPLGFQTSLLDNGWEAFQAAASPMRKSSLLNAVVFSALLVVVFCLVAVIYYRIRWKEIAIARALGVPVRKCVRDVSVPLLLLGFLGVGAGGILGWQYTLTNAWRILQAISEFGDGKTADLSIFWLAALLVGALIPLVLIITGGASVLSNRPVLALIQGGTLTVWKEHSEPVQTTTATVPGVQLAAAQVPRHQMGRLTATENMGAVHVLRFALRYITRSKLKSVLAVFLAFGFTAGLAAIQLSIARSQNKIDWLYENTLVEAELVQADTTRTIQSSGGFIRMDTIDTLLQSGYITNVYLEGAANGAVVPYVSGMEDNQAVHVSQGYINKSVRAFEDEKIFLSAAGSGGAVTITYFDGWDGSLFAQEWTEEQFPVVLSKAVYEGFGDKIALSCKGFQVCEVAGYYEGDVSGENGETDPVLIPLSAYQQMSDSRLVYCKAHVTLNPFLNRELEAFTQTITEISSTQRGAVALRALIWDEELRLAVAPLENSIKLMQVLYPVTLVLSLLVAAGLAVLFVMTNAKEVAIMRVLGTSRLRSCMTLALQTVFTNIVGLLVGLVSILLYIWRTQPELLGASILCATLYLLSAILGSAISAAILTSRNPLELLQVKE